MASDDRSEKEVVTLKPEDQIAYRRYVESLADFAEAHEALASILAEDSDQGRRIAGGRRKYHLGREDMPTMGATCSSDEGEVSIVTPRRRDASPGE